MGLDLVALEPNPDSLGSSLDDPVYSLWDEAAWRLEFWSQPTASFGVISGRRSLDLGLASFTVAKRVSALGKACAKLIFVWRFTSRKGVLR